MDVLDNENVLASFAQNAAQRDSSEVLSAHISNLQATMCFCALDDVQFPGCVSDLTKAPAGSSALKRDVCIS
jgi:hypothetical protein